MSKAAEGLGPAGPISLALPNFTHRYQQQAMAEAVERAISERGLLVCEAGTGTGKTFAYLVPVVKGGKRVLISTGTKHLQDQLFERDLPLVRRALGQPVRVALLKGRANYLCWQRLASTDGRPLDRATMGQRIAVQKWAGRTRIGDTAELPELSETAAVWPLVTSTADNCLGSQCRYYDDCFVVKARRRALDADIVVVNHHLFFADLALREEGFGELLPTVDAVILDEAHLVPDIATQFFGTSLSTRQLSFLVDDALDTCAKEATDVQGLADLGAVLRRAIEASQGKLARGEPRSTWVSALQQPGVAESTEDLSAALGSFAAAVGSMRERGGEFATCADRALAAVARLEAILRCEDEDQVVWLETFRRSTTWHATPLEIGPILRAHIEAQPKAWIFTSATLSVAGSCAHFAKRVGLQEWDEVCLPSPFDYPNQWLGYLPTGLPDPRDEDFHARLSAAILPVLRASRGRAFLLFTSYRGLERCRAALESHLEFPILVQGAAPRNELLNQFRRLGNAVLFGTSSFWQGVDVRGDALSCVVIDKLPFEAPGDPVLAARLDHLREHGEDPFRVHQLPQAVITLKQGVGRLIRGEQDRGLVMFGDRRLLQQGYGRVFLESLPPLPMTRTFDDVVRFFADPAIAPADESSGKVVQNSG